METIAKDSGIIQRTLDLCGAIASESDFPMLRAKVDAFMADEQVKFLFQQVNNMGQILRTKQGQGLDLTDEEVGQFEKMREELLANPLAKGYLDAQQEIERVHQVVGRFVEKTFELGRRPEYEEAHDGSCGGCGCH
jgi:cell fate (sporulation/competence/biofilm development) regulator YlbF (YheA/YmcA/DUF963 family)